MPKHVFTSVHLTTILGISTTASMTPAQAPPKVAGEASTSDAINIPPIAQEILRKVLASCAAPHVAQIVRSFCPPSGFGKSSRCIHTISFNRYNY